MLLESKQEWKCYICIDDFDNDIIPSFQCTTCNEGKICYLCYSNPNFEMRECGICREPHIVERNTNNVNLIDNRAHVRVHAFCFLFPFILFILDYLICIVLIQLKHLKCSNIQHLLFPLTFIGKLMCLWLMNYLYFFCFKRLIFMHYIRVLEHFFIFYTLWFIYVYNKDNNIECSYYIHYILYYIYFILAVLPINFFIGITVTCCIGS